MRRALKRAQNILWHGLSEASGPSDDETLAALWLIFSDADLIAAAEANPGRLGAAVRDIRARLRGRKAQSRLSTSRHILAALWHDSPLGAAWLHRALGGSDERLKFLQSRLHRGRGAAS
jgi:hypothetical protein